ncbi:MAG TPA: O-antigen ligase family protein [Gallicola sp.]|nr:O-antigen ligase family protein [Gallicola sp.]
MKNLYSNNSIRRANSKRNVYDFLLIITISLLIFGGFGGSLQPIRIFSLVMIPFVFQFLLKQSRKKQIVQITRAVAILYLFFIVSLLWTSDTNEGLKEIVYYGIHLNIFLLIVMSYLKAHKPFNSLLIGWMVFIFLTQIIAFNEIFFDKHLDLSILEADKLINVGGMLVQKKFAAVTFGNYNGYVTVVALSLPFLFGLFASVEKKTHQIISLAIISFAYFTLFINASRGGILAGIVVLGIFLFFSKKIKIKKVRYILLLIVPLLLILIYRYYDIIFEQLFYRRLAGSSFTQDDGRFALFSKALQAFYNKPFFGGGIGSLQKEMTGASILAPHNMFLEVLVQFGFFVSLFFLIYLIKHFAQVKKIYKPVNSFIIYAALLSLPVASIINSGYLLMPTFWVFLASLYCIAFIKTDVTKYHDYKLSI